MTVSVAVTMLLVCSNRNDSVCRSRNAFGALQERNDVYSTYNAFAVLLNRNDYSRHNAFGVLIEMTMSISFTIPLVCSNRNDNLYSSYRNDNVYSS